MIEIDRLVAPDASEPQEERFDRAIRPKSLADYIGQPAVCEQMSIFVSAAVLALVGLVLAWLITEPRKQSLSPEESEAPIIAGRPGTQP